MDTLRSVLKLIGLALFAALALAFMVWVGTYVLAFLALFLVTSGIVMCLFAALFVVVYVFGIPIAVHKNGVLIGHWRRGKFYQRGSQ